jgi:hypothetical protein
MFAYSFVRDRSFSAVKEGDGLVIREKVSPGDYVGRKVAGVLSISPTRWAGTPFTPVFEIGASPENNVGLFAGIGLSPYGLFHFGGGYTLQQVTRLSGQTVGQTVGSADDIKTEKHFRSGAYLHISIIKKIGG